MHRRRVAAALLLLAAAAPLRPAAASAYWSANCTALASSHANVVATRYTGDACLLRTGGLRNWQNDKAYCESLYGGGVAHMAHFVHWRAVQAAGSFATGGTWWVALNRDRSATGVNNGWYWLDENDSRHYLPPVSANAALHDTSNNFLPWWPSQPSHADHCGAIRGDTDDLFHATCTNGWSTICMIYDGDVAKGSRRWLYKAVLHNAISANVLHIDSITAPSAIVCQVKCSKLLLCRSVSYNGSTRHCVLQYAESFNPNIHVLPTAGYTWFDRIVGEE